MERTIEKIENKYEDFLQILKTNPEIIESQAIKNESKELLEFAFKQANYDNRLIGIITELLELNIVDKNEIKEQFKDFINIAFKEAKKNHTWAYLIPIWLKSNIIDKNEIKEQCKELLNIAIEKAKSDSGWAYVVTTWLKSDIVDKNEIKEQYKEYLDVVFKEAKNHRYYLKEIPKLLSLNITDKDKIKEPYKKLIEELFEQGKYYNNFGKTIQKLLGTNILDKSDKERYKKLLKSIFKKTLDYNLKNALQELLEINILDKSDKERCKQELQEVSEMNDKLLELNIRDEDDKKRYEGKIINNWGKRYLHYLFKIIELNQDGVGIRLLSNLIKLNIIDKNEIKEQYKELIAAILKNITYDPKAYWIETLSKLLEFNIIDKSEIKEEYKKTLDKLVYEGEEVLPNLLELNIIDKDEIKERYKELLNELVEQVQKNVFKIKTVSKLLEINIIDKDEIKERYKELLNMAIEKAKSDPGRANNVVPELLKVNIVDKNEIKEQYKEMLNMAFEDTKSSYRELDRNLIRALLKLNIMNLNEINKDMLKNITFTCTSFLEKNKENIKIEDLKFIEEIGECFTKDEINYLYKLDYENWKNVRNAVNNKDYQAIWGIKKLFYPQEEKDKIQEMEKYFGKGIWTYFVDKVPGNKTLKNRFRDPHNALLHMSLIVDLAEELNEKGFSKQDFIKNYLGVAGDRNNGYQQLNDFLEKYKSDWKELVEGAMNMNEFKKNSEFMNLAKGILEQEKTGELYKSLDNLEQVLTLLHMITNKDALIKLWKLASSDNPDDKKLYEYYKGAIYHPRTKSIIMEMYENPGEFLGLDDTTFRNLERIHQAKKPSNMVENFEFLDFDAKDLVNCLPLGIYDKLSYFKPFEMKFYISGNAVYSQNELNNKVSEFLSSIDQKKITNIIKKLKENGDETMWYQTWKKNKVNFIDELTTKYTPTDLIDLFVNLGYSEFNKYKNLKEMTAKISSKSDPNNRFNGFNCDSLAEGHGKKVVAMFNPYCTDFCIYEGDQDPKKDNLRVTSWVTLNRAIPENFTTLLGKVKSNTTHDISNVLGDKFEDYKDPSEYVITMDNIEANPNFGRKNESAVRKMYEKFFSEYVRQNPVSPNGIPINTSKFYSGVNYNKLNILTDRVPNESLPVFVNAYSDNSAQYSLKGDLDAGEQKEKQKKVGIYPLSIEDVVQISYLEGKIYPSSMKDHLGNLQHEITASILNNTLKNRPNLSFTRYNEEGKIGGYILAYQGKMKDGTPGIYISDFAMDKKERGTAGVKMIHHWMDEVKKNYPDMPVFTRARENTSYRMIKTFAERKGYEIVEDEILEDGGENFHRVALNPRNQGVKQ